MVSGSPESIKFTRASSLEVCSNLDSSCRCLLTAYGLAIWPWHNCWKCCCWRGSKLVNDSLDYAYIGPFMVSAQHDWENSIDCSSISYSIHSFICRSQQRHCILYFPSIL